MLSANRYNKVKHGETMGFEKLLYVANSAEPSAEAIRRLAGLHRIGLAEVIICVPDDGDQWEQEAGAFGLKATSLTVAGPLVSGLMGAVRQEGASVIATPIEARQKGRVAKGYARELLKLSHVPVIFMPAVDEPSATEEGGMFHRVVLAADSSESCREAMRYLLTFKGVIKELEIIHVVGKRLSIKEMRELRQMLSAWRSAFLDHLIDAEFHIYAGKIHEEILLAVRDYGGTCIVMGSPKKSSIKSMLKPSCAYRVAQASPVPTMIVP